MFNKVFATYQQDEQWYQAKKSKLSKTASLISWYWKVIPVLL
jgi:hypothetical protein